MGHAVINAGRTNKLRDNDSLGAVDDKGAAVGHYREVAHIDLGLLNNAGLLILKADCHTHGRCVVRVSLLALAHRILRLVVKAVINEAEHPVPGIVRNIGHVAEDLFEALLDEPIVGRLLNLDEVGHIHDLVDLTEAHALAASSCNGFHFQHRQNHSVLLNFRFSLGKSKFCGISPYIL